MYKEELDGSETIRRRTKVFKNMEKILSNGRTSEQIRGHHKKMKEKYHSIDSIIENLEERLSRFNSKNKQCEEKKFVTK